VVQPPSSAPASVVGWHDDINGTLGPGATRLYFRVNDDVAGNGNGAFHIHLQVWR
jgi:hypothetical protein